MSQVLQEKIISEMLSAAAIRVQDLSAFFADGKDTAAEKITGQNKFPCLIMRQGKILQNVAQYKNLYYSDRPRYSRTEWPYTNLVFSLAHSERAVHNPEIAVVEVSEE